MKKRKSILLFSVIIMLVFTSCNNKQEQSEENPVPQELKNIEESVEEIMVLLSAPGLSEDEKEESESGEKEQEGQGSQEENGKQGENGNDKSKEEENGKNSEGEGGQSNSQNKNSEQSEGNKQETDPKQAEQKKSVENWKEIDNVVKDLHSVWNSYMPKAVKDGVNMDLLNTFGKSLNDLTDTVQTKSNAQLLLAANELYSFIPQALARYDSDVNPGIKKIRYYARNAIYNSNIGNWEQASKDIQNLQVTWSTIKDTIGKEQRKETEKLNYAISDLSKVTDERNKRLIFIKGEITMKNIDDMEKAIEDKAKQEKDRQK